MNETSENPKNPWQVSEILEKRLPDRARQAGDRLRTILTAKIIVELTETKRRLMIDWTTKQMAVSLVSPEATADTVIRLSERTLQAIARGDLNPQLAIVSGTVFISGKTEPALYLFNLLLD